MPGMRVGWVRRAGTPDLCPNQTARTEATRQEGSARSPPHPAFLPTWRARALGSQSSRTGGFCAGEGGRPSEMPPPPALLWHRLQGCELRGFPGEKLRGQGRKGCSGQRRSGQPAYRGLGPRDKERSSLSPCFDGGLAECFLGTASEAPGGYSCVKSGLWGVGWTRDHPVVSEHRTGLLGRW